MEFIKWLNEIDKKDVALFGGKNASLGELYRNLSAKGIRVPKGFAISASAYRFFIESAGLEKKIKGALSDFDKKDLRELKERGRYIRQLILNADLPEKLEKEIRRHTDSLKRFMEKM